MNQSDNQLDNAEANESVIPSETLDHEQNIGAKEPDSIEGGSNETINPVQRIRGLVGTKAVLLPVRKGEKRPAIADWQKTTIERMDDPDYLAQLETGNIGVLLGAPSSGLCAIDIDDGAAVEPFLALNPALRGTLRTKGARGAQIWIQVADEYPKLTKLKTCDGGDWGEWRGDGGQSVIYGIHPSGADYQVLHRAKPVELEFADIQWPTQLKLPWVKTDFDVLVESEGEPFTISERGGVTLNQMFFVKKYTLEHHVLYDSGLGDFFQYEAVSGLWKKQSVEGIKRQFLEDLSTAAREARLSAVYLKRTDGFVGGLVNLLKATTETRDAFASRPPAIHVANGMICFDKDGATLMTFHPTYLSRNKCPFEFDPNAECPRFLDELLKTALDDDDIRLLQRWAGAVLLGHNAAQRFLMLLGTPGGGKSTVMSVLERTIGLQNVSQMRTEHLSDKFELYGFAGKTLLTGKDVSADFLMHKGAHVLKALVGHDLLEAEKKGFNERVQIRGDFNVGITCNSDLNIRLEGDAGAWRRRLLVIKYERPAPTKKIAGFADQLLAEEGPGILRWMVEGAMDLLDEIQELGDYRLTEAQQDRIDQLMNQSDSVRRFVQDGVVRVKGQDITTAELLGGYYGFCEERGWHPQSSSELRRQLTQHMLEIHKVASRNDISRLSKAARGYKHVALVGGGNLND